MSDDRDEQQPMTDENRRVLAQWRFVHGTEAEPYESGMLLEAIGGDGRTWRLWKVTEPAADDPFSAGLRLAPVDDPDDVTFIEQWGGGKDLDMASLHIASREEVRANADAVRRELGLD